MTTSAALIAEVQESKDIMIQSYVGFKQSLEQYESKLKEIEAALENKSNNDHEHDSIDFGPINEKLDTKSNIGHKHLSSDIEDFDQKISDKINTKDSVPFDSVAGLSQKFNTKAELIHAHTLGQVSGLTTTLAQKANVQHNHLMSDISDIDSFFKIVYKSLIRSHVGTKISVPIPSGFEKSECLFFWIVDNRNLYVNSNNEITVPNLDYRSEDDNHSLPVDTQCVIFASKQNIVSI